MRKIALAIVFVLITTLGKNKTIEVPDVSNKSLNEAIEILQDKGFNVTDEQEGVSSKDIEVGDVVKTSPAAGTKRKKGSDIKIYVSTGDTTIEIEDYTGKNYLEIKGSLEARGLVVNIEEEIVDSESEFENDEIVRQSVEPEEKLQKGGSITLYVASVGITYPDFTDGTYNVSDVEDFCEENEIELQVVYEESNTHLDGTIFYQSREAGTPAKKGAKFKIKVYTSTVEEDDESICTEEDRELGNCE